MPCTMHWHAEVGWLMCLVNTSWKSHRANEASSLLLDLQVGTYLLAGSIPAKATKNLRLILAKCTYEVLAGKKLRPDRPSYVSGNIWCLSQQMSSRKNNNATMLGVSFCIGTILGTYRSDQVTAVNFVNRRQPSIITLRRFFLPPKPHTYIWLKSVLP